MTYHGDRHQLLCHICGHTEATPTNCPVCSKATISFRIIGTKAVVDEVKRLFPGAKIQRFDTDNKTGERLESQLQNIRDGKVDILIGTQVIAKGLDLPGLTTLGVIAADSSMVLPDFTASERTYQLLNQVLGRIGRNNKASQAIIQTLNPDNQLIAAALNGDWDGFYQSEIEERRKYFFPPFCNILVLTFRRTSQKSAEGAALKFKSHLLDKIPALVIEGPAPSFHEKLDGQYQWQIVIKAKNRSDLLLALKNTPKGNFSYNIDPINLL
jgi:primosomal protein N' (replication factor Y)